MKFNTWKCQEFPLDKNNPMHQDRLGAKRLEGTLAEMGLGVLVGTKFKVI